MERMTKVDENIQTAQNLLSGIVERCYKLEQENKNLEEENLLQLAEIRRLREHLGEYKRLKKENKKLKEEKEFFYKSAKQFREENIKLKETIKDHQLYEEKLEHRIIEFEELLHGE